MRPVDSASSSATSTGRTRTFTFPSSSTAPSRIFSGQAAMSTLSAATTARASPRRRSRRSARPSTRRLRASALMQDLGRAALVLAFGLVVYAAIGGGLGAYTRRRRLVASARNALFASFGATAVASIVLLNAFRTRDFSFAYVAEHSSKALPFPYVYTAFWGGQEGSLLLWLLVLTGIGSAAVAFNRRLTTEVLPWTVPVLGGVATFFTLLLVFVASPFATQVAPADGAGLNPSLQNPYMMIHPPLLYLGYVGLTIPFAFAAGALLSGRFDERWIVATRRWTILAWTALGSSASSRSRRPSRLCSSSGGCRCCGRGRSSSRSPRARPLSSTTTCCSSPSR